MIVSNRFTPLACTAITMATGLALTLSSTVLAGDLGAGQSATVDETSPVERWTLMNGARVTLTPGAESNKISAYSASVVNASGATITDTGSALLLIDSTALIRNSSMRSTQRYGLEMLTQLDGSGGSGGGSTATVTNSQIEGVSRGISATANAQLTLENTHVRGSGNGTGNVTQGGVGAMLLGARASLQDSSVTGDHIGMVLIRDISVTTGNTVQLVLEHSTVQGKAGSAITVGGAGIGVTGSGLSADITVANGSSLVGGNGRILEVRQSNVVAMTVDNSRLNGNIVADEVADLALTFNKGAWLTGSIEGADTLAIDASSGWSLTGDSQVDQLTLSGMVDLRGTDGNASFVHLQVGELSGSGAFALGTDLAAGLGDFLDVGGTATGSYSLLVENTGVEPSRNADDLRVVHTGGGDADFAVVGETVDAGAYTYRLEQRSDGSGANDWFLVQVKQASRSTSAAVGLFSAAPTVWYGETSTLRTRMGELRNGTGQGGGWLRSYGSKHNVSGGSEFAYSQRQQGISFGADMPLPTSNGQWLVGVMGGYSNSTLDLKADSSGKVGSFHIGAYSTWLADNGFYVDALLKANRLQNRTDVIMRDGQKSKGRYTQHGIGASVEVGKRIALGEDSFVAPYAQLSGLWITAGDYSLDNGLHAQGNNADSLVSKVGAQVGRRFPLANGGSIQPHVKVAVAHEFANHNQVNVNGNRFENDLSGTRGELGLGVSAQIGDRLQVHADFDYMQGKNIEQPWGASVGVRYNF